MADNEKLVSTDIILATRIIKRAWLKPAPPVIKPSLRKSMIPRIVRMLGVNTPVNVPSLAPPDWGIPFGAICGFLLFCRQWLEWLWDYQADIF